MTDSPSQSSNDQQDENKLIVERRNKLTTIREQKANAFPNSFRRDAYAQELQETFADKEKAELETLDKILHSNTVSLPIGLQFNAKTE